MTTEMMFSLAIRKKENPDDFFAYHDDYEFVECNIDTERKYWLADPFVYENDGKTYLFFEAYDLIEKRGKLGYSEYYEDGTCSKIHIIINEKYHLSFPNLMEIDGSICMMPECCEDYTVKLYEAEVFPEQWIQKKTLLPDVYACDSVIINHDAQRYLLTNEMYHNTPGEKVRSCWVKNCLYRMEKDGQMTPLGQVAEGDFGIRNAGQIFSMQNGLFRIGQDCRFDSYGRGLVLFKIESLEPYRESMVWSKDFEEFKGHIHLLKEHQLIGVHTYNSSEHYEIIDYSYMQTISMGQKCKRANKMMRDVVRPFIVAIKRMLSNG